MTKISDVEMRSRDPELREFLEQLTFYWNSGKIGFTPTSTVPTDTPSDYEIRFFSSGATRRLYAFFPGDAWRYVDLT